MQRRDFIILLGSAVVVWPPTARAQKSNIARIGFLGASLNSVETAATYQIFLAELRQFGFTEGQNLIIDYHRVDDPRGPFVAATELMRAPVDLIVAQGPEVALQAVVGASRAVPIVIMATNYDPIERGYVTSLAQPGGNITGVFYRQLELAQKQVELLAQAFPDRTRLAVLFDAQSADQFKAAEREAGSKHLELRPLMLEKPPYDFGAAFRHFSDEAAQMVLVLSSPFFTEHRSEVAQLAIEYHLPSMFIFKSYVEAGGLMSYGASQAAMFRRLADYVAKILKGAKATDLPVEQATTFELVVNLKTARALGVKMPEAILLRADELIE